MSAYEAAGLSRARACSLGHDGDLALDGRGRSYCRACALAAGRRGGAITSENERRRWEAEARARGHISTAEVARAAGMAPHRVTFLLRRGVVSPSGPWPRRTGGRISWSVEDAVVLRAVASVVRLDERRAVSRAARAMARAGEEGILVVSSSPGAGPVSRFVDSASLPSVSVLIDLAAIAGLVRSRLTPVARGA